MRTNTHGLTAEATPRRTPRHLEPKGAHAQSYQGKGACTHTVLPLKHTHAHRLQLKASHSLVPEAFPRGWMVKMDDRKDLLKSESKIVPASVSLEYYKREDWKLKLINSLDILKWEVSFPERNLISFN